MVYWWYITIDNFTAKYNYYGFNELLTHNCQMAVTGTYPGPQDLLPAPVMICELLVAMKLVNKCL